MDIPRRNELIKTLQSIKYWASLTYLSSEMCIEVTIFTSDGVIQEWISEDEWQIYRLNPVDFEMWDRIKRQLANGILSIDSIKNTDLESLLNSYYGNNSIYEIDCNNVLAGLCDLPSKLSSYIYCYIDYNEEFHFYSSEDNLAVFLATERTETDKQWEDMNDDELDYWYGMYENEDHSIPCFSFDN